MPVRVDWLAAAIARSKFHHFVNRALPELLPGLELEDEWIIKAMAKVVDDVLEGRERRVIINAPPRTLKSTILSVLLPAFVLGHDPSAKIMCISYGQTLTDYFSRAFKRLVEGAWYKRVFPKTRFSERQALHDFKTSHGGCRHASSTGGAVTGFGADLIIIDDAQKAEDARSEADRARVNAWFDETLSTRLNDPRTGSIIVVMQRVHEDDLTGHLLERGGWSLTRIPAEAMSAVSYRLSDGDTRRFKMGALLLPDRLTRDVLERAKRDLASSGGYAAQYLQDPLPRDGEMVSPGWFKTDDTPIEPHGADRVVQSWDTASSDSELSDYSVCTTWVQRDGRHHLIAVHRAKHRYPDLKRAAIAQAELWGPRTILIENAASGKALIQDLQNEEGGMPVVPVTPIADKVTRFSNVTGLIEAGRVALPKEAPWRDALIREVLAFPHARHDDQVDSMSQYLEYVRRRGKRVYGVPIAEVI